MILALTAAALSWPVSTTVTRSQPSLDRYLPPRDLRPILAVMSHANSGFLPDDGNGWTRLTTETRVCGLDPPGRRVWLDAIRARAERDNRPTHA